MTVSPSNKTGSDDRLREVPSVTLTGSTAEQLEALEASIAHLLRLRHELTGDSLQPTMPPELHGPYLNAPVWPWFLAGWIVGALFVLMFVFASFWSK